MTETAEHISEPYHTASKNKELRDSLQTLFSWKPAYVSGCNLTYTPLIYWLASQLRPKLVINHGVGDGSSHFAICEAAQELDLSSQIFGIDTWAETDTRSLPSIPDTLAAHSAKFHTGRSRLICADPENAADLFDLGNVDLLVADRKVSIDLLDHITSTWIPLMSRSSAIVLRGVSTNFSADVQKRLDEFRTGRPNILFDEVDGILVVFCGDPPSGSLAAFLDLQEEDPERKEALGIFRWVGAALTDRQGLSDAKARNSELNATIEFERNARRKIEQRLSEVEEELSLSKGQRDDYLTQLGMREAVAADLTRRLDAQAESLVEAQSIIAEHHDNIHALSTRVDELLLENKQVSKANTELEENLAKVKAAFEKAVQSASGAIEKADLAVGELATLREKLTSQIADRDAALTEAVKKSENQSRICLDLEATVERQRKELFALTLKTEQLRKEVEKKVESPHTHDVFVQEAGRTKNENPSVPSQTTNKPPRLRSFTFRLFRRGTQTPNLSKQAKALKQSVYFDSAWYAKTYPDCGGPAKAAMHYLREGAFVGNDPGPRFSTTGYYQRNPDVASSDWAALAHYVFYGKAEGRVFDPLAPDEVI